MAEDARTDGVAYIEPSPAAEKCENLGCLATRCMGCRARSGSRGGGSQRRVVRWMSPANRTRPTNEALAQAKLAAELAATSEPVVSFAHMAVKGQRRPATVRFHLNLS